MANGNGTANWVKWVFGILFALLSLFVQQVIAKEQNNDSIHTQIRKEIQGGDTDLRDRMDRNKDKVLDDIESIHVAQTTMLVQQAEMNAILKQIKEKLVD